MTTVSALTEYRLLPGRLRIAIPGLCSNKKLAGVLTERLQQLEGISSVSANPLTGRMLILFDASRLGLKDIQSAIIRVGQQGNSSTDSASLPAISVEQPNKVLKLPSMPVIYATVTGGVLAGMVAKRLLMGRSPLASSQQVFNLAAITTIISGYPILKSGLDDLAKKKQLNSDLLLFGATLVLLAMRESITGLSVLWLVHLSNLFQYIMQAKSRQAIRRIVADKQQCASDVVNIEEQVVPATPISTPLAERHSGRLMIWTAAAAAGIFLITRDFRRSLAVLLAGCPVAVMLARNTASGAAIAQAARAGILVKDARCLEAVEQIDTVLFDKTATLTQSRLMLTNTIAIAAGITDDDLLRLAAAAASGLSNPMANMLRQAAEERNWNLEPVIEQRNKAGGFGAVIAGRHILCGSERLMAEAGIDIAAAAFKTRRLNHQGDGVLYVAIEDKLAGIIGFNETLRPFSRNAVERLRSVGVRDIGLVTGDSSGAAEVIADKLGLTAQWGNLMPVEKAQLIRVMQQQGRQVMMVGDGANDVLAMSASNISVAMGSCGDISTVEKADIVLAEDNPDKTADLISLSRRTGEVARQNLTIAVGLNVIGISLAAASVINPIMASLLLNFSTAAVILNSSRLLRSLATSKPKRTQLDLQQFAETQVGIESVFPGNNVVWHTYDTTALCKELSTSDRFGLGDLEVQQRLRHYGPNALAECPRASFGELLAKQFKDFMVQVLLGAAGISFVLGRRGHALLTGAIVITNAILGVMQERKAEQSIDSLRKLAAPQARVIRGGRVKKVDAAALVPGDVIVLEAGDRVPADARLITTIHLEVQEASLTGETFPAKKQASFIAESSTSLGDRKNMIYMGTGVSRGRATAVVVATGMQTEMGKIAAIIQQRNEEVTPLQRRLEELGKYLVYGCLAVSGIVMASGLLRGQGLVNMLQMAASLAVAAIPEGMTTIVVIALAMGVERMSRRNIIVRKLSSLETLGCATVICSDKTGTLTKNEMTVRAIYTAGCLWHVGGEGYMPEGSFYRGDDKIDPCSSAELMQTLISGALCNNAKLHREKICRDSKVIPLDEQSACLWHIEGDPTEGALVVAAAKVGLWCDDLAHSYIRLREIPFESERRMMSVVYRSQEGRMTIYTKGAPDSVLGNCTHCLQAGEIVAMTETMRQQILAANETMTGEALRVLACAYRTIQEDEDWENGAELEQSLIFCGLAGMIDPPRAEVPEAINKCRQAGVKVVMITGDHPNTARAIACELGLLAGGDKILVGSDIDSMSDKQLAQIIDKTVVYARTSPHHKLRIIKALKDKGYVVAMTGDGVNDAPAVKAADIGIAMGIMGTDVTKEAASMTLSDDNFATIVHAMEEGRSIYVNIRKAIRYLLATNIGEVLLMFLAALMGMPLPLSPIQLLWINLVGDGLPAVALVNDPPAKNIMNQPPRSAEDSVFADGLGYKVLARGAIIGVTSLALYRWVLKTTGNLPLAQTLILTQLAISQFVHLFDCRTEKQAGETVLFSNPWLIGAVIMSMAMVVAVIYLPFLQPIFGTTVLSPVHWLIALATAGLTALMDSGLIKLIERNMQAQTPIKACQPALLPATQH